MHARSRLDHRQLTTETDEKRDAARPHGRFLGRTWLLNTPSIGNFMMRRVAGCYFVIKYESETISVSFGTSLFVYEELK